MTETIRNKEQTNATAPTAAAESRKPWVEPKMSAAQDALEVTMASAGTAVATVS